MDMNVKALLLSRPGFLCDPGQVTSPPKPHERGEGPTLGSLDLKPTHPLLAQLRVLLQGGGLGEQ